MFLFLNCFFMFLDGWWKVHGPWFFGTPNCPKSHGSSSGPVPGCCMRFPVDCLIGLATPQLAPYNSTGHPRMQCWDRWKKEEKGRWFQLEAEKKKVAWKGKSIEWSSRVDFARSQLEDDVIKLRQDTCDCTWHLGNRKSIDSIWACQIVVCRWALWFWMILIYVLICSDAISCPPWQTLVWMVWRCLKMFDTLW